MINLSNLRCPLPVSIRPLRNYRGIVIPKPILGQLGPVGEADLPFKGGALLARVGWADAAKAVEFSRDAKLLLGEFANESDEGLAW